MPKHMKRMARAGLALAVSMVVTITFVPSAADARVGAAGQAPSPRKGARMAYDAVNHEVVLFGGGDDAENFADTWAWVGDAWTLLSPAHSPSARRGVGMAYDAGREQIVLFGGSQSESGRFYNDTWIWDGSDWSMLTPPHSPSPRWYPAMVYDAARGGVILFGGTGKRAFGDTWRWDGTDWTLLHPGLRPAPRSVAGVAYDAAHSDVVLWGGWGARHGGPLRDLRSTWTWDGMTWTNRQPAHFPSRRELPGMTFDAGRDQVVLFGGGHHLGPCLDDTWTWDGTDWSQLDPAQSPAPRCNVGITYDFASGRVILFGGVNLNPTQYFGDTWSWNGTVWTLL
jgi:hypothetical protein